MTPEEILEAAVSEAITGRDMFRAIGRYLGIPYQEREKDRVINVRHEGKWVKDEPGVKRWDDGKDISRENWPDSYNNIDEALLKLGRPQAIWYHIPSMNLVIQDETQKVGIRSSTYRVFGLGFVESRLVQLICGLQEKMRLDA